MSGEAKAQQFFIYSSTRGWQVFKTEQPRVLCQPIHVIEKSAYQKAVDALKEIYADGSYTDIAAEIATTALKELGEL